MDKIISEFNSLLRKENACAVLKRISEGTTEAIVGNKNNSHEFKKAVERAINETQDCSCEIRNATSSDYGYTIDMDVRIRQGDADWGERYELIYATKF